MSKKLIAFLILVLAFVSSCEETPEPEIRIWHGTNQKVGHLGLAQDDFNLMGEFTNSKIVTTLQFQLNDDPYQNLQFGKDPSGGRRLAAENHFNADISIEELNLGENTVSIQALDKYGRAIREVVTLNKLQGDYQLPVQIRWKDIADPQNVVQFVDGEWLKVKNGLRTEHTGYDRMFIVGTKDWQDYEVTVPITINKVDDQTSKVSGGNGVGILMRFTSHVIGGYRNFPVAQPKWGYQPFGAIGWLRWEKGKLQVPPQKQFFAGYSDVQLNHGEFPIRIGGKYIFKVRCETLSEIPKAGLVKDKQILIEEDYIIHKAGKRVKQKVAEDQQKWVTQYNFKIWNIEDAEPLKWDWQVIQVSTHALQKGGVAFIAHHIDATFGDINIEPIAIGPANGIN